MNKKQSIFDLHIAMRVYPGVSKSPFIFPGDKFRLFKTGIYSLRNSLKGINYKITFIMDNCPDRYDEVVKEVFGETQHLQIVTVKKSGNANTFLKQIEVLLEKDDSDVLMLAEDDYLYTGESLKLLINLLQAKIADFVTPYDHSDYYTLLIHKKNMPEIRFNQKIFKSVNSTCLTFLTTRKILIAAQAVFKSYLRNNSDASIFWSLTKEHVLSPVSFFKFLLEALHGNDQFLRLFVKAWIYSPIQNIFGKKYKILTPQPSFATHMEKDSLSPGFDWDKIASKLVEEYNI